MHKVIFATGNNDKFAMAHKTCAVYGIELSQEDFDVDEIQGEDMEKVVSQKAKSAFAVANEPIVVSDDFWSITELNGFPGAYMKSMNHWFCVDDFSRLFKGLKDREIFLLQNLAYYDGNDLQKFTIKTPGKILDNPKGVSGPPFAKLVELDGDEGKTISEIFDLRESGEWQKDHERHAAKVWHEFAEWYISSIN